ncbi:MAG: CDP-alcohol phosphatidyltransferase family protein [Kofleriaceae bacterium]
MRAVGTDAARAIEVLVGGGAVEQLAAALPTAARCPHGDVARHPVRTAAEAAAAQRLLYRILVKPQDNVITRVLYRPVSLPLTRLLVRTPITPNQVSLLVALMVGVGIWLAAHADLGRVLAGTVVILAASYLDCCDGEIARVKLLSSRFGAWLDTIVDELSSLGYMVALGWHCHLRYGPDYLGALGADPWLIAIAVATVGYVVTIYVVYWNIIVLVGSANSQDYVGRFEPAPGPTLGTQRLVPKAATAALYASRPLPQPLRLLAEYLPYVVRRDFISWGAVVLAAVHATHVSFALQAAGGVVTAIIVGLDHVRVRGQLRQIARAGDRFVR